MSSELPLMMFFVTILILWLYWHGADIQALKDQRHIDNRNIFNRLAALEEQQANDNDA